MIGVQAINWLATLGFLATGALSLAQVSTAAIAPPLFLAALLVLHPRRHRPTALPGPATPGRSRCAAPTRCSTGWA